MISTLIVDDQKHIRDGLHAMLEQLSLTTDPIYCATNGYEALELLRKQDIDLVITDIRMPDMDGLTLMQQSRMEGHKVNFVIISGYDEFSYAQKAIELGVKGYLLKPVKRDDLQLAVEHVVQEIRIQEGLAQNIAHISRLAQETERRELSLFMKGSAAKDWLWIEETEKKSPQLWHSYTVYLLREELSLNQPNANRIHHIEAIVSQLYDSEQYLWIEQRPYLVLAISSLHNPQTLIKTLQSEHINVLTVVSDQYAGLASLPQCYLQITDLLRHSYLFPDKRYISSSLLQHLEQNWELPYESIYALFQYIGTNNSNKISLALSSLFHKNTLQRYSIRYTQQLCRTMTELLEDHVRVISPYIGDHALDINALRHLFDFPGIREYLLVLQQQLVKLNQYYYEFKINYRNTQDLNEAIRFIHENYHKPIDLAMVSNHVSLNYTYFSNLFKRNIGKGFAEYLRDIRLDKAKRLLAETDYKINEIATMVGYESYKSFTRTFRELVNMQPTEFREAMRRKAKREEQ